MFPDAEGWENVDDDDVAKWGTGSEFPADTPEQNHMHAGAAKERPTGSYHLLNQALVHFCSYIPIISWNNGEMTNIACDLPTFWQYFDFEYSRAWKKLF